MKKFEKEKIVEEEFDDLNDRIENEFKKIKQNQERINDRDESGRTILHKIFLLRHPNKKEEMVRYLVDKKADLNLKDDQDYPAFNHAITHKNISNEIIKYLLENKASINLFIGNVEYSYLYSLCYDLQLDTEKILLLLQYKADPNYIGIEDQSTPFQIIVEKQDFNDLSVIKSMLENKGDPNRKTHFGSIFGSYCIKTNLDFDVLNQFLVSRADPNIVDQKNNSPFIFLCRNENVKEEYIELFLNYNANPILNNFFGGISPFEEYLKNCNFSVKGIQYFFDFFESKMTKINIYKFFSIFCSNNKITFNSLKYFISRISIKKEKKQINYLLIILCKNPSVNLEILKLVFEELIDQKILNKKPAKSPLKYYSKNKNFQLKILQYLVEKKLNPFFITKNGKNISHFVSKNNVSKETLQYLIQIKCKLDKKDKKERTCLFYLSSNEKLDVETIEFYFQHQKEEKESLNSSLLALCENPRVNNKILSLFIDQKADIETTDEMENNIFHLLSSNKNYEMSSNKFATTHLLSQKNVYSLTPFHNILKNKISLKILNFFLSENNVSPNIVSNDHSSPFHLFLLNISPSEEYLDSLKLFLQHKANPNLKFMNGKTPFFFHCSSELISPETTKIFLEYHSDPNIKNTRDVTPFQQFCSNNKLDIEILKILIEQKADLNNKDFLLDSPLHDICSNLNVNTEMIELLIEKKADMFGENNYLQTPFHKLCKKDDFSLANFYCFLKRGININQEESITKNPSQILIETFALSKKKNFEDFKNVLSIFISHKADINFSKTQLREINPEKVKFVGEIIEENNSKGTLWSLKIHRFFPTKFKEKIFMFVICLKYYSRAKNLLFPKPLIHVIVYLSSIEDNKYNKRKEIEEKEENKNTKKIKIANQIF